DGVPHRATLPRVYNQYTRVDADPVYDRTHEPHLALFRPLFTTAFLLEDFLAQHDDFGAQVIALTSASSKTALGLASLLVQQRHGHRHVVGLTSTANAAFVARTGYYDDVVTYDDLDPLRRVGGAVLVDFAGNGALLARVHQHFGSGLAYSCRVGLTHWERGGAPEELAGPRPVFFFAPTQVAQRVADWGAAEFQHRIGTALRRFLTSSSPWLRIME